MNHNRKKIVLIGATSAIAEHCARLWVKNAAIELVLVGRDRKKMERVASDLRVRSPNSVMQVLEVNFTDAPAIQGLVDGIVLNGVVDVVLIAHGSLPDQQNCQQDLSACSEALLLNGISPVIFAEAFANHMERANRGVLAIIGSVAGDRGRKSNYAYGSAKGLVARYAQGLQHRFANSGVKVVLVKPGPTDTPMTAHLKEKTANLAKVELVAELIVSGVKKGSRTVYVPGKWAVIMMILRHLPAFIFNKLNI